MDDKIIKLKNRVEIKILLIVCFIIFIPLFILLISEIIKRGFNELWPFVFMFSIILLIFVFVLFVINRFCITFDYKKSEIMYTPYFRKTKVYKFNDVKIYYCKGKTTLSNDYVFNFINNNKVIFKISSIDFEFKTKEKVDLLKEFFDGNQKHFYELEKTLKISNGKLFIITYELDEDIAVVYLPKAITIDLGYIKSDQKFYLTVYKDGDWNNQLEVLETDDIEEIKGILQKLIDKYSL